MAGPDRSIILYRGSGLTPTTDYTDVTDWPGSELTAMADSTQAGSGSWLVRDEDGTIPDYRLGKFLNSHNVVIARTGSNILWRGRLADQRHFRGRQKAARAAEWTLTVEDQNSHLRGIIVNSWARPIETDVARVQALAAAYLSGSPRASTNLNGSNLVITSSNTVMLPAQTYNGVEVAEVLAEIQRNADKEAFVTVDNELAYFGHDYTGYASLIRISDSPADANSTTFAPINPEGSLFGRAQTTALRYYWGLSSSKTLKLTAPAATETDYWEDVFWDSDSPTDAAATAKAQKILDVKSQEETTYKCSIGPLSADDVWKLKVGQTISFKSRGARGGRNPAGTFYADSFQTVRVREVAWTMPAEDEYFARLELQRPRRVSPVSQGDQALVTANVANGAAIYGGAVSTDWWVRMSVYVTNGINSNILASFNSSTVTAHVGIGYADWGLGGGATLAIGLEANGGGTILAVAAGLVDGSWHTLYFGISGSTQFLSVDGGAVVTLATENSAWQAPGTYRIEIQNNGLPSGDPAGELGVDYITGATMIDDFARVVAAGSWAGSWVRSNGAFGDLTLKVDGNVGYIFNDAFYRSLLTTDYGSTAGATVIAYTGHEYGPVLIATASGSTSAWSFPYAYVPGTLMVYVDNILQTATEVNPATGAFSLGWTPASGDRISAKARLT
jgi:hypothetical protein